MKKKIIFILTLLTIFSPVFAFNRLIYPQTVTPDFTVSDDVVGWSINLPVTTSTFQGLAVTIEFSTGPTALNQTILVLGSNYQGTIDYGLSFYEHNSQILVTRHVKQGSTIGFFNTVSWRNDLLKRNTNYILQVEIDETRYRYSIYEKGKEEEIKIEYEFYGLASSYLKLRWIDSGIAIGVSKKHYMVQTLRIEDLGYGTGVIPTPVKMPTHYGHIINKNSGLYLRRSGDTAPSDYIEQREISGSCNDIWQMQTFFQNNRPLLNYGVEVSNMYLDAYITPKDCSKDENAYLKEARSSDCKQWSLERTASTSNYFYLKNQYSDKYMVVEGASKSSGAYIIQSSNKSDLSSLWSFAPIQIEAPLKTGYYVFKNINSDKYLSILDKSTSIGAYAVQHSDDRSDAKVWHVVKQPEGSYTLRNITTNGYLSVQNYSFIENAYIDQQGKVEGASQKWIIVKENNKFVLKNFASGKKLYIYFDLKDENEYILQNSGDKTSNYWDIQPVDYNIPLLTGGVFNIKNPYTGYYLTVQNGGTASGAYLIDTKTGLGKESWWTIETYQNGAYLIKNVNSQMYMTVKGGSEIEDQYIIQTPSDGTAYGTSLWRLISDPQEPNLYWVQCIFDGKVIFTLYGSTEPDSYITQHTLTGEGPAYYEKKLRWQFIPINRTETLEERSVDVTERIDNNQIQLNKIEVTQSNNIFNIHSKIEKIKNIDVISIDGKLTKKQKVNSYNFEIDLSLLATGIYILNINLENGSYESKKIRIN